MSEEMKKEQTQQTEQVDNQSPAEAEKPQVDNKIPYERFKQKVDEVNELKRKLAEIEKERDEAERKKLEEQNEYKALYEKAQAELEKLKMSALDAKKDALLAQAGYTSEQIERYRKYLTGENEDELKASLETLIADIPPKKIVGVDPSVGNNEKQQPKPKDAADVGRSIFQRLKEKGKIR
jgi:predicted transcriptional regulator